MEKTNETNANILNMKRLLKLEEDELSCHRKHVNELTSDISKIQKDIEDKQKDIEDKQKDIKDKQKYMKDLENRITELQTKIEDTEDLLLENEKYVARRKYRKLWYTYDKFIDQLLYDNIIDEEYVSKYSKLKEFCYYKQF